MLSHTVGRTRASALKGSNNNSRSEITFVAVSEISTCVELLVVNVLAMTIHVL